MGRAVGSRGGSGGARAWGRQRVTGPLKIHAARDGAYNSTASEDTFSAIGGGLLIDTLEDQLHVAPITLV